MCPSDAFRLRACLTGWFRLVSDPGPKQPTPLLVPIYVAQLSEALLAPTHGATSPTNC